MKTKSLTLSLVLVSLMVVTASAQSRKERKILYSSQYNYEILHRFIQ